MDVIWDLNGIVRRPETVLTVGTFDGIHLGHQYIIAEIKRRARVTHQETTLVTFEPHPKMVIPAKNGYHLKLLTTIEEKIELLRAHGLDRLVIIPFNREFANTGSRDFVIGVL